jgi:hypothetical protein
MNNNLISRIGKNGKNRIVQILKLYSLQIFYIHITILMIQSILKTNLNKEYLITWILQNYLNKDMKRHISTK